MTSSDTSSLTITDLTRLTKEIVTAYLLQNPLSAEELPRLIHITHAALSKVANSNGDTTAIISDGVAETVELRRPAVSIRKSVNEEYIICLEDGKKLKMLKRHLRARYNMTPDAYREKWGLPADYPMVAPAYARQRSSFAKSIGLGRGPKSPKGGK
jgi:predicted transcriptional regulator